MGGGALSARNQQSYAAPTSATIPNCVLTTSLEVPLALQTQQVPYQFSPSHLHLPTSPLPPKFHFLSLSWTHSSSCLSGSSQMANLICFLSFLLCCPFPLLPLSLHRSRSLCLDFCRSPQEPCSTSILLHGYGSDFRLDTFLPEKPTKAPDFMHYKIPLLPYALIAMILKYALSYISFFLFWPQFALPVLFLIYFTQIPLSNPKCSFCDAIFILSLSLENTSLKVKLKCQLCHVVFLLRPQLGDLSHVSTLKHLISLLRHC